MPEILTCWRFAARASQSAHTIAQLKQDNAWYQSRDVALAGAKLLKPLARSEVHLVLHVVFGAWRCFIVDLRNMEVVQRIVGELHQRKARATSLTTWAAQQVLTSERLQSMHSVLLMWRHHVMDVRLDRVARCTTVVLQKEAARRAHLKQVSLVSKILDSWRWSSASSQSPPYRRPIASGGLLEDQRRAFVLGHTQQFRQDALRTLDCCGPDRSSARHQQSCTSPVAAASSQCFPGLLSDTVRRPAVTQMPAQSQGLAFSHHSPPHLTRQC